MGPMPKLYMSILNRSLTKMSEERGWRAPTQFGFRPSHRTEDGALVVDTAI